MMMPEKDGWQVCRELRETRRRVAIPIILLTARADEETKFNALEMGANDFLAKPFSSTELHARIKNLVESHDFQRKLSRQNQALSTAIEQLKETEMQLVQSEKLASLGRMSAGIIHEINNPLNFATTGLFALRNKGKQLRAGGARRIRGNPERRRGGHQARAQHRVRFAHVHASRRPAPAEPVDVAEAVDAVAAVPGRRMEGQGADRTENRRRARSFWPTATN